MKELSDQAILDSVIRGNQADYSIIVDRYKNKAFSLLKRMLKNEQDAEETLQDCFLKAYNSLITGGSILDVKIELGILLVFGIALFIFGVNTLTPSEEDL